MLFFSQGKVSTLYKKIKQSFEIGFVLLKGIFDRLTLKEVGEFPLDFFSCFNYTLILFFDFFS